MLRLNYIFFMPGLYSAKNNCQFSKLTFKLLNLASENSIIDRLLVFFSGIIAYPQNFGQESQTKKPIIIKVIGQDFINVSVYC